MEMEYVSEFLPAPIILEHDEYKGYEYYITSVGTHPCCYAEIPVEHDFYRNRTIESLSIPCHGGITYTGHLGHIGPKSNKLFIGWDYAHCTDFIGFYLEYPALIRKFWPQHKWTTEELIQECKEVIDYLAGLEQGYAEVGAGVEHNLQNEKE